VALTIVRAGASSIRSTRRTAKRSLSGCAFARATARRCRGCIDEDRFRRRHYARGKLRRRSEPPATHGQIRRGRRRRLFAPGVPVRHRPTRITWRAVETIEGVRLIKQNLIVKTVLGVSNIRSVAGAAREPSIQCSLSLHQSRSTGIVNARSSRLLRLARSQVRSLAENCCSMHRERRATGLAHRPRAENRPQPAHIVPSPFSAVL